MSAQTERWFSYGEPTGNGRVEATIRTSYYTGPNRHKDDGVERGTVGYDALDVLENNAEVREHTHDDNSVLLSGLSAEAEAKLLETFEPIGMEDRLRETVNEGVAAAPALDYCMVVYGEYSQSEWARQRGVSQQTVSGNTSKAREQLVE